MPVKKKKTNTDINQMKAILKEIGMSEYEIENRLYQYKTLKGWKPISAKELQKMSVSDLKNVLSFCWKEGNPRCDCIGISDVKINKCDEIPTQSVYYKVQWSDETGDPILYINSLDILIDQVGDGTWEYGLYIKKNK